jgi:hypothetical protein
MIEALGVAGPALICILQQLQPPLPWVQLCAGRRAMVIGHSIIIDGHKTGSRGGTMLPTRFNHAKTLSGM